MRRRSPGSTALTALLALLALLSLGFEWEGRLSRLRRELETGDAARRREVVRLLGAYPAAEVGPSLLGALGDSDAGVRAEAADAVGRVRLREAVPRLLDWLDDADADVRASAARALGRIADPRSVQPLVRALGDSNAAVRQAAVGALASIGTPEVVVPLLGRLDDDSGEVRIDAAHALGRLRDPRAVVPLVGRARDESPEVRVAVYNALGELGDARAVATLLRGLSDEANEPRLAAIAALGQIGEGTAVDALVAQLSRVDQRDARAVVAALGAIGDERSLETIVAALERHEMRDTASDVLVAAARRRGAGDDASARGADLVPLLSDALERATTHAHATAIASVLRRILADGADPRAARALLAALRAGRGVPAPIMEALAATGSPDALVPLLERLLDSDPAIQQAAIDSLGIYFDRNGPDGRAADPLLSALGRAAPSMRAQVVALLGRAKAARALPALRPLLEHPDPALRLAAARAIGAIGDPEGASALLPLLDEDDPRARFEAAQALGAAGSARSVATLLDKLEQERPFDRHAALLALGGALPRLDAQNALPAPLAARSFEALIASARGPDEALAAAALDALRRWRPARAASPIAALLDHRSATRRRAAASALGAFDRPEALAALRRAVERGADPALRTAAAGALGENGDRSDADRLIALARDGAWPVSAAAAFGVARLARRGRLDASSQGAPLCALARSRHAYVRTNAAIAIAAIGGATCADGPHPEDWLDARHAGAVRAAAIRWLASSAHSGGFDEAELRAKLERCLTDELAPEVVSVCRDPSLPSLDATVDVWVYAADGERLLTDRLTAIRLADGSVLVGYTDINGHVRLGNAPEGAIVVDDPASTPLEP